MATLTKNFSLTKPDASENIDISVLNGNFDKIDDQLKKAADALPPVATTEVAGIVKPDGTTLKIDKDGTMHGANTYQLPIASAEQLGGVKIGKNLTMQEDGTLNAYASLNTDAAPTHGSENVPTSGGTYDMIHDVDTKVNALDERVNVLVTGITWKNAVDTFDSIAATYPAPEVGWTVLCLDTGYAYQWNGAEWITVYIQLAPMATTAEVEAVLGV